jgi:hypothetical protein
MRRLVIPLEEGESNWTMRGDKGSQLAGRHLYAARCCIPPTLALIQEAHPYSSHQSHVRFQRQDWAIRWDVRRSAGGRTRSRWLHQRIVQSPSRRHHIPDRRPPVSASTAHGTVAAWLIYLYIEQRVAHETSPTHCHLGLYRFSRFRQYRQPAHKRRSHASDYGYPLLVIRRLREWTSSIPSP